MVLKFRRVGFNGDINTGHIVYQLFDIRGVVVNRLHLRLRTNSVAKKRYVGWMLISRFVSGALGSYHENEQDA
jgi:hypothetical protein